MMGVLVNVTYSGVGGKGGWREIERKRLEGYLRSHLFFCVVVVLKHIPVVNERKAGKRPGHVPSPSWGRQTDIYNHMGSKCTLHTERTLIARPCN